MRKGEKFGYIVNGAKSWLIVKNSELAEMAKKVFGDEVNITVMYLKTREQSQLPALSFFICPSAHSSLRKSGILSLY